jgi:hypothetical protein
MEEWVNRYALARDASAEMAQEKGGPISKNAGLGIGI